MSIVHSIYNSFAQACEQVGGFGVWLIACLPPISIPMGDHDVHVTSQEKRRKTQGRRKKRHPSMKGLSIHHDLDYDIIWLRTERI
jgi:hypothetical protein